MRFAGAALLLCPTIDWHHRIVSLPPDFRAQHLINIQIRIRIEIPIAI